MGLRQIVGDHPVMVGVASYEGEFVETLDKIYWHPAVATRWDSATRTFAFWWSGDGGHFHTHKYRRLVETPTGFHLLCDSEGIFIEEEIPGWARVALGEYEQTDEYHMFKDMKLLDKVFVHAMADPPLVDPPSRPYDVVIEFSMITEDEDAEKSLLGAWACSDDEIAYCEMPGARGQDVDGPLARGFKPREILEWWMEKKDYILRVRRGTVMARSADWAARRALHDQILEIRNDRIFQSIQIGGFVVR